MKNLLVLFVAWLVTACATMAPHSASPIDPIARDFVQLALELGEHDEGYIDAYHGPVEWREAARANPRPIAQLAVAAAELDSRLKAIDPARLPPIENRRQVSLGGQLLAARTRLRMLAGEQLGFAEEARGLYGVTPELRPLEDFDPVLARIERLLPGSGPLAERVERFQDRFVIPSDRLDLVMRAAIDECRRRTIRHLDLPAGESFSLEFVTGKSWSGYNWYQGDYDSLIQINTDLPVRIGRAVDLGCHEGYPGHHAYNVLLEQHLARGRQWVEYLVYPLHSPQSFIAEGSANYGVALAFPGREQIRFETETLYPLAGLPADQAQAYLALTEAMDELGAARFTIARDYLERRVDREQTIARLEHYQLVSRARAEQILAFIDQYRSYVINYGLGRDMVKSHIERQGQSPQDRWKAMERILTEPTHPDHLERR